MSNIDKLKPGKYAILFRNNWDGEDDTYEAFATLDAEGIWRNEDGDELLEYQGDEVMRAWPLDDGSNVLALLDELEAAERWIAELSHHLQCAHGFIEHTEAFGHEASNGILCCGDAQWNIDESKSVLAAAGKGEES